MKRMILVATLALLVTGCESAAEKAANNQFALNNSKVIGRLPDGRPVNYVKLDNGDKIYFVDGAASTTVNWETKSGKSTTDHSSTYFEGYQR